MKKVFRFFLVIALALALTGLSYAENGSIISGMDPQAAYEDMLSLFKIGEYSEALTVIQENSLSELNFADSKNYEYYINAVQYMNEGEYGMARSLLDGLKELTFEDSETIWCYASARIAEEDKDYATAIELYGKCLSYRDSAKRKLDCEKMKNAQIEEQANDYFLEGQRRQDVELLKKALELYNELGAKGEANAKLCRENIESIEKELKYIESLDAYAKARQDKDLRTLTELEAYFSSLGNYKDSKKVVEDIADFIKNINRFISLNAISATSNSIALSWEDSSKDKCSYLISYAPVNNKTVQNAITSERTATIENLYPDTEYIINLTVENSPEHYASINVSTKAAESYVNQGFFIDRASVIGVNRSYLFLSTLEEIWTKNPKLMTYFENNHIQLEDAEMYAQPQSYIFSLSYRQDLPLNEEFSIHWILRSKTSGIYTTEPVTYSVLPKIGRLYISLDSLLTELYLNCDCYPEETLTMELYINDQLAGKGIVSLTQN